MPPDNVPTVLIVEDEPHAANVRRIYLEESGFNSLTAATLRDAIEILEQTPKVDCLITDINLDPSTPSNADGIGVAKLLKMTRPGIPIVGYSAYLQGADIEEADLFDAFLPKSGQAMEQLAEVVTTLVGARNLAEGISSGEIEPLSFLCHNSQDKPLVRRLDRVLQSKGIQTWLDERDLRPGQPWQEAIEDVIGTSGSALILVGGNGGGPWADMEMRAFLEEFVRRGIPLIPVLLPGNYETPELPIFLRKFTWVDLRSGVRAKGVEKLIWGITGEKPES